MYFKLIAEGKTEAEALYIVETNIYKKGVLAAKLLSITARSTGVAVAMS